MKVCSYVLKYSVTNIVIRTKTKSINCTINISSCVVSSFYATGTK